MKTKTSPPGPFSTEGRSSVIALRHIGQCNDTDTEEGAPCHWSQQRALPRKESVSIMNESNTRRYSRHELHDCPAILRAIFEDCKQEVFVRITCAISCVLSSEQRLSAQALSEAVALYMDYQEHSIPARECATVFRSSLSSLNTLFSIKASGQLMYTTPTMPQFLRTYPIRGIDASHRTLAMLCLEQMQRIREGEHEDKQVAYDRSAFSVYAMENWQHHYRIAKRTSLFLNLRNTFNNSILPVLARRSPSTCHPHVQEEHRLRAEGSRSPLLGDKSCSDEWEMVDAEEMELG